MEYQKLEFFGKKYTDGKDRTEDYLLFGNLKDNSIIDIGCNIGFYSIKAAIDGAKSILAIDNHQPFLNTAKKVTDDLEISNIIYENKDIMKSKFAIDSFDVVFILNVVHHFHSIKQVKELTEKCYIWAKKRIIYEVIKSDKIWSWETNSKNNRKIALSVDFFKEMFPNNQIYSWDSRCTENRMFIEIWK